MMHIDGGASTGWSVGGSGTWLTTNAKSVDDLAGESMVTGVSQGVAPGPGLSKISVGADTGGHAQTPGQVNPLSIPSRRGHNASRWMAAIILLSMAHLACAGEQTPALHLEDFLRPQPGTVLTYTDQNGERLNVHAEPGASSGTLPLIRERVRPQDGTMPTDQASLPRVIREKAILSIQGQQLVEEIHGRRSVLLDVSKAEWPISVAVLRTVEGEGDTWAIIFGSCRREPPKSRYLFGAHREVIDVVCTIDDPMMGNMRFRHVFASGLGLGGINL